MEKAELGIKQFLTTSKSCHHNTLCYLIWKHILRPFILALAYLNVIFILHVSITFSAYGYAILHVYFLLHPAQILIDPCLELYGPFLESKLSDNLVMYLAISRYSGYCLRCRRLSTYCQLCCHENNKFEMKDGEWEKWPSCHPLKPIKYLPLRFYIKLLRGPILQPVIFWCLKFFVLPEM